MKYSLIKTFLAAVAVFFAVNANGQTRTGETTSTFPKVTPVDDAAGLTPHIGVRAGLASPEGSYDSAPELGIDFGLQAYIPFGVGGEITQSKSSAQRGGRDLERTTVLAKGTYNFGGSTPVIKHSWVGVAAGPVFRHNGTDLGVAPILGFDIPLSEQRRRYLSLGADAKYLALINSSDSDAVSINGTVKYWF